MLTIRLNLCCKMSILEIAFKKIRTRIPYVRDGKLWITTDLLKNKIKLLINLNQPISFHPCSDGLEQ